MQEKECYIDINNINYQTNEFCMDIDRKIWIDINEKIFIDNNKKIWMDKYIKNLIMEKKIDNGKKI